MATFACISLVRGDRIFLTGFPSDQHPGIEQIIANNWASGIQDARRGEPLELKLRGNPWLGSKDGVEWLFGNLLQYLHCLGWVFVTGIAPNQRYLDKDALYFRSQQPAPPPIQWAGVSFRSGDLPHLINTPVELSQQLAASLGSTVKKHRPYGDGIYEIKFHGYPWRKSSNDALTTHEIMLNILAIFSRYQFSLYGSMRHSGSNLFDKSDEGDTLYLIRALNYQSR